MKLSYWQIIPLLLFIFLATFLWKGLSLKPDELPSMQVGKKLPNFKLPSISLHARKSDIFLSKSILGEISLLNVWSSWCSACTEEQSFLLKLSNDGIRIYGLNYKDNTKAAIEWLKIWGDPYIVSGVDKDGMVGFDFGVYGSPETFLLDKHGVVKYRYAGILNEVIWQEKFIPLINQLRND